MRGSHYLNSPNDQLEQKKIVLEPRRNPHLFGQERAEQILAGNFIDQKLPHAWMLTGNRGIGKATLAYRFARYVLAGGPLRIPHKQSLAPLETNNIYKENKTSPLFIPTDNPTFQRVGANGHSDFMAVETAFKKNKNSKGVISVDDIRKLNGFLRLTSGEGGWQVIVIDNADDLTRGAENALLKILEEPPPNALLLLVCDRPKKLLPTTRSRCQKLRLNNLDDTTIDNLLDQYLPHLDLKMRNRLVTLSEGSIGRVIELAMNNGVEIHNNILNFLSQMPEIDFSHLQDFSAKISRADAGKKFEIMTHLTLLLLWRLVHYVCGSNKNELQREEIEIFNHLKTCATLDRWLKIWEETNDLLVNTSYVNLDRKQVILNIFLNISKTTREG
ncbi:MAG: DNA polymerase III subunit delta' [Magnetovibrio sp.]|nr:DNA polymerase III subunit delta' [Magnetovibrio sp.]|tara:strand:+ start:504 stop:1664 length:1161 start_codon:yes stop_codon:yes gene_type:complete